MDRRAFLTGIGAPPRHVRAAGERVVVHFPENGFHDLADTVEDCGHLFWGEAKRKGRIEGRREGITKYYTCAGRRTHGRKGCRDKKVRQVLASYVQQITISPADKSGVMALAPAAFGLYEENDRRKGRSWVNMVAGARYVPFHIRAAFWRRFRVAA